MQRRLTKRILCMTAVIVLLLTSAPFVTFAEEIITAVTTPYTFSYEDSNISVDAHISRDTVFTSNGTALKNSEVQLEGDTSDDGRFAELSRDFDGEILTVGLSFTSGGEEVEQEKGSTELTLTFPESEDRSVGNAEVFRYTETENGEDGFIERVAVSGSEDNSITFDAGELTSYAVRYTVDYFYEDQQFSMTGGEYMLLSELFEQLLIKRDSADVESITFTDDSLIRFTRTDNECDWIIQSLKPFDTEETMTLFFSDGYSFKIKVTDDQTYSESSSRAENNGCRVENTDTGVRFTFNNLWKDDSGNLYPFYGVQYFVVPKNLEALKKIEAQAKLNALQGGEQKATYTNTVSAKGTSAQASVKIGVTNDFMPIDKKSKTFLELLDSSSGDRIQLSDKTDPLTGETYRDTPDGIQSDDISRYIMQYTVTLNKGKEKLNGGQDITAEDEYSDNLSVDFTTIHITTDPPDANVSYDFSGNTGYFTFPDETAVTIEYEAVILSNAAGIFNVSNEVRMLEYRKGLSDFVEHGGSGGSSGYNPSVLIKKFGAGHMEQGLDGAVFQLYEYNYATYTRGDPNNPNDWTPVTIPNPAPHNAFFTTHEIEGLGHGYVYIELSQQVDGIALQTGKVYGLREIETPTSLAPNNDIIKYSNPHGDGFFCYIFTICEEGQTADYRNYVYLQDDTITVRNYPESTLLNMKKNLVGNSAMTDQEMDSLHYQIFRKQEDNGEYKYMPIMTDGLDEQGLPIDVIDERFRNITYREIAQSENGADITGLTVESGTSVGEYILVEYGNEDILAAHPDWAWRGTYIWSDGTEGTFSGQKHTVYDETGTTASEVYGIPFTVTSQEIRNGESKEVTIDNSYSRETVNLTANKRWTSPTGTTTSWSSGKAVTFELGTIGEGGGFNALSDRTITLDNVKDSNGEDTAGSAVFKDLPKYEVVVDDNHQLTKQAIRYAVRESVGVTGYDVIYPTANAEYAEFGSSTGVTIKNQVVSTSISVSKSWDRAIPFNATATLRLYAYTGSDASSAYWVSNVNDITLDGTPETDEGTFGERAAWRADFTGLPEYDSGGRRLTYIVKEVSCTPAGYEADEEYAASGGVIHNRPAGTSFTVRKQWSGTPNDAWPSGEKITLSLKRKTRDGTPDTSFSSDYVITGDSIISQGDIIDRYGESRQTGTWSNGVLTVSDLQKYNGEGKEWLYYISETAVTDVSSGEDLSGNYAVTYRDKNNYTQQSMTYSGGSITNTKSSKQLTISKTVEGNMGNRTADFRFTVTLTSGDTPYSGSVNCLHSYQDGTTDDETLSFVNGSAQITLKHGESYTLTNLSGSLLFTVTENQNDAADYTTTYSINGSDLVTSKTVSGTLADNPEVAFVNTRQVLLPTGVGSGASLALIPALIFGAVIITLTIEKRRRREM